MSKIEKEIKILNINVEEATERLRKIGAEFINKKSQKIYTYDIPTIYYRYLEAKELLSSKNPLIASCSIKKICILLEEFVDLTDDSTISAIYSEIGINSFEKLLDYDSNKCLELLNNSKTLEKEISKYMINPNKWIRVRQSNDKVELTIKHVFKKNNSKIQNVKEYEISTSDLEETNQILEGLGLVRRNYQEKVRYSFKYKNAEIEIDEWPLLNPYIEIESDNETLIDEIIKLLGYEDKEIVSLNTEQLYKIIDIDILAISDLKF